MTNEELLDAIGEISEEKIERARAPQRRRRAFIWAVAAAAAVLVLVLPAALKGAPPPGPTDTPPDLPPETQPVTPPETQPYVPVLTSPDAVPETQLLLAEAEYPLMVQYQDDEQAWSQASAERRMALLELPVELDAWLDASLPALLGETQGKNIVCSPPNLYLALAMAAELSGGETREQLLNALGAESIEALRTNADALWQHAYRDDGVAKSVLASSLWMRRGLAYNDEIVQTLREQYRASTFYGKMDDPAYQQALRDWLNEQTGGQLKDAADSVTLSPETVLELATTICFRAKWLEQFDPADTAPGTFHAPGGDVTCDFLCAPDTSIWLCFGQHFTAMIKSFEAAGDICFVLPEEGLAPEELLRDPEVMTLFKQGWSADFDDPLSFHWYIGDLKLPKLDVVSDLELQDTLRSLGVTDAFDEARADFSPMFGEAQDVALSGVRHAARLTMDEEGVSATAFTDMGWGAGGPEGERDFTLDRPFLFSVMTDQSAGPLFVGVVNDPCQ